MKKIPPAPLGNAATCISNDLIARYGLGKAMVISKLIYQKTKAVHKRMKEKYGKIEN